MYSDEERRMDPIRLLIADDHTFYREGIRAMLQGLVEIEMVGEAATGDETVAQAEVIQPDVILMDIKMPGMNGIEATRRILNASPHIRVLVVTMFEDDESVFAAMRAGRGATCSRTRITMSCCGR